MKKKKIILMILFLAFGSIISYTFSYFSDSTDLLNVFKINKYKTEIIENFVSPDNWLPGNTVEKIVYVDNTGDIDVAVRLKIEEEWVASNGTKLSGIQNGNRAALISFPNPDDWIQIDGYYYYKNKLLGHSKTNNFIDSVTFNSKIEADSGCVKEYGDRIIKTVSSSSDIGYAGATYKLKIKADTIQFDLYKEIWNIDLEIEE